MRRVTLSLLPPLVLILVVLGSIFAGVATPTEAGALGAVGAMALAATNRRFNLEMLRAAMEETSRITVMVVFLLIGTTAFALVFRGLSGDLWIADVLSNLPGGPLGFLIVVNVTVFLLGFFIDFFEIAFIIVPLIVLPAEQLGDQPRLARNHTRNQPADVLSHATVRVLAVLPARRYTRGNCDRDAVPRCHPIHCSAGPGARSIHPVRCTERRSRAGHAVSPKDDGRQADEGNAGDAVQSRSPIDDRLPPAGRIVWTKGYERLLADPAFRPLVQRVGPVRLPT